MIDDFVLTLWTSDRALARLADAAGVQRIGTDLEQIGKRTRQHGRGTWISPHTLDDLMALRTVVTPGRLFARVNPLHPGTADEVEAVLAAGAAVLMLPMVATPNEAAEFVRTVDGRARVVLLVECREAIEALADLVAVAGVDEVHLGLNDLAISLGLANRWLVLAGDIPARAGELVRRAGCRFGLGGIGRVDDDTLPIASDLVYAEYARTGATAAVLARSFFANTAPSDVNLEITRAQARLACWRSRDAPALSAAHAELARRAQTLATW